MTLCAYLFARTRVGRVITRDDAVSSFANEVIAAASIVRAAVGADQEEFVADLRKGTVIVDLAFTDRGTDAGRRDTLVD
jgi:hypothetical protein